MVSIFLTSIKLLSTLTLFQLGNTSFRPTVTVPTIDTRTATDSLHAGERWLVVLLLNTYNATLDWEVLKP